MKTRALHVIWTEVAKSDVERIATYLAVENPLRAAAIVDRIVERAESLASLPNRGRVPPELRAIGDRTWRESQEPPWRILYRRLDDVVQIHAVLDGRRSLEDILMERVLRS
jgi:plasmid stabilization system protein ParE